MTGISTTSSNHHLVPLVGCHGMHACVAAITKGLTL